MRVIGARVAADFPVRLEEEWGGELIASLQEIPAREAEGHFTGETRDARLESERVLGGPIASDRQGVRTHGLVDVTAFLVQEDRILKARARVTPVVESDDERVLAAAVSAGAVVRDVKRARARAVGADMEVVDGVDEPLRGFRHGQGTRGKRLELGKEAQESLAAVAVKFARDATEISNQSVERARQRRELYLSGLRRRNDLERSLEKPTNRTGGGQGPGSPRGTARGRLWILRRALATDVFGLLELRDQSVDAGDVTRASPADGGRPQHTRRFDGCERFFLSRFGPGNGNGSGSDDLPQDRLFEVGADPGQESRGGLSRTRKVDGDPAGESAGNAILLGKLVDESRIGFGIRIEQLRAVEGRLLRQETPEHFANFVLFSHRAEETRGAGDGAPLCGRFCGDGEETLARDLLDELALGTRELHIGRQQVPDRARRDGGDHIERAAQDSGTVEKF